MISNQILKSVAKIGARLTLVISIVALFFGRALWASGVLVGAAWIFLNFYFLFRLLDVATSSDVAPRRMTGRYKDQIFLLSILKFPVIYVAGFFVLKSRFFPVSGILTGLTVFFAALVLSWRSFYRGSFGT